ncbi:MAG: YdcF family protein [Gemmatimonadota bacterium]|jgi:uncharacterized SAM-binding protein YcdF (DUF218 family)|nr:YdcF family protein [Gemmatimonadota bacterium]
MFFLRSLITALLLAVFSWGLTVLTIHAFGMRDEARPVDAIVVLGAAQYDGRPSPVLKARLDHALELHARGYSSRVILTGGVGIGDTVSEARVGARYMEHAGVQAADILLESRGRSSEESLDSVARLMETHGLNTALLVSDPFHMLRLRLLAAQLGLRAYSTPTRGSPIVHGSPEEWRYIFRESFILPSLIFGGLLPVRELSELPEELPGTPPAERTAE